MLVSMHMPCSAYLCTKFTKDRMIQNMGWVQKKICNYLWKNNWFNPAVSFEPKSHTKNIEKFTEILNNTFPVFKLTASETEWKSYALEIAFHDKQLRKYIFSKSGWLERYFLYFNFIQMSSFEKTGLANKVIVSANEVLS